MIAGREKLCWQTSHCKVVVRGIGVAADKMAVFHVPPGLTSISTTLADRPYSNLYSSPYG